ncbi:uncharacterized protein PF3D7_1120600-like [Diorhabda sublineata]|uniref:uncharacterized protein PF3D7_1120600-like n=1 Tax=Diorhabda sublineata TaxID=1163346 RepID=UPI0024E0C18C|nr:uncharacterized protein PF3D7_1120600-like [Diorhabda sublineata]
MSMLAERKRKQKWSLNPRGKEWSQDANKFGQKMLEKMGWQNGKGLGRKEDGITEHIKVSHKNDNKGMGYKETNDQWTEHETNFSALLESLTGEKIVEDDTKVSCLEQKSQTSRARVHYHKFTRGKDLSRYSEKDLANIFGRKSLQKSKKEENNVDCTNQEKSNDLLVNGGSMMDYFKKKLPNFGKSNGYIVGNNGVLQKAESEAEFRNSFGFGFKADSADKNRCSESESEIGQSFGFGFNSKQKEATESTFVSYISGNKRPAEEIEDEVFSPKKKSKKNKLKIVENNGISNPAFNPMSTPVKIQKHILNTIEENVTEDIDEENDKLNTSNSLEILEGKSKTRKGTEENEENICDTSVNKFKKKKKKIKDAIETGEVKNLKDIYHVEHSSIEEVSHKKSKKKKKMPKTEKSIDNSVFDENEDLSIDVFQIEENYFEVPLKKPKKNKNKIHMENSLNDCTKNVYETKDNPYDFKGKKTKKKNREIETDSEKSIENPTFNDDEDESINIYEVNENPYEIPAKKVIKKKKKKEDKSIDNPVFNEAEETSSSDYQIEKNPFEVEIKKSKKSRKIEIDNMNYNDTDLSLIQDNPYEVKPKKNKKKNKTVADNNIEDQQEKIENMNPCKVKSKKRKLEAKGIENPALDLNNTNNEESIIPEEFDLMLNIVSTPIQKEQTKTIPVGSVNRVESVKRRKSVRFSDVTQELIIPNNDELKEMYKKKDKSKKKDLDNINFDEHNIDLQENINTISKTLDNYQAEIENDMNEEKMKTVTTEDFMVGEVGNPDGENEQVIDGVKLKFKYANMNTKTPFYMLESVGAKKSYKHLIKGDILLTFKDSNLHKIKGYGVKNPTNF